MMDNRLSSKQALITRRPRQNAGNGERGHRAGKKSSLTNRTGKVMKVGLGSERHI